MDGQQGVVGDEETVVNEGVEHVVSAGRRGEDAVHPLRDALEREAAVESRDGVSHRSVPGVEYEVRTGNRRTVSLSDDDVDGVVQRRFGEPRVASSQ